MPIGLRDADDMLRRLEQDGIEHLWVAYHDYSGVASAKTAPPESFRSTVRDGVVFAMANLDMDILDVQPATATLLADSGDFLAVPDPRSYAVLPRFPKTARTYAWMRATDGSPWQGCPRTRLDGIVEELRREGFSVQAALEPEFYLLTREANGEYVPINQTRMFTMEGMQAEQAFVTRVVDELRAMGVGIGQFGKEYGRGQYEMSIRHGPPIQAIDDYWSLKEVVRDVARDFGYIATFMPKVYANWVGNSLHVHLSVWDAMGQTDLTPSDDDETSLSDVGSWFMGGLLKHAAALTGLGSPTVNSYKRLLPGSWAPANTYWGYGNRSGVARVPGVGKRRHIEYRSGDNSCNPALFLTGLLAAGLDGIRNRIDPGPPFQGDIGHLSVEEIERHQIKFLPRTLPEALAALESDPVIAGAVGEVALAHFLSVKRSELAQYELDVHPWERAAYLEVI
ncbi:MAG: glutamine synthetase [Thermomicrobiales bacterium]|jgi:glutamine synthetase|nr:glutamine synthetase [Thermomicrobiales bacterium]